MQVKHRNIPIFLPELACPHQCVFCNQRHISGQYSVPNVADVRATIEQYLSTIPTCHDVQVAFFGGSFTGLPVSAQREYLQVVLPYIQSGRVQGIRISTRPDYITPEILDLLKEYFVQDIELGAQSLCNTVLALSGRGHTVHDVEIACERILQAGFQLGLQMMIGLPGDTFEKSYATAQKIIALGAHTTRIYPTLVIRDTPLALLYAKGTYKPLDLHEAVAWVKEIFLLFQQHNVLVLRTGLHPSDELQNGFHLLAGPYHPSFKELVLSKIWYDIFVQCIEIQKGTLCIEVSPQQLNFAIGHASSNKKYLLSLVSCVNIVANPLFTNYEFTYSYC